MTKPRTPEQYEKHISRLKTTIKRLEYCEEHEAKLKNQAWRDRDDNKKEAITWAASTHTARNELNKAQERITELEADLVAKGEESDANWLESTLNAGSENAYKDAFRMALNKVEEMIPMPPPTIEIVR